MEAETSTFVALSGMRIAYDRWGQGPPPDLILGAFSEQRTNWLYVRPLGDCANPSDGGADNDLVDGRKGADTILAGEGDDRFIDRNDAGRRFDGGGGPRHARDRR